MRCWLQGFVGAPRTQDAPSLANSPLPKPRQRREGEGLMRWADGTEHRGGWSEGRPHGHGVRVSAAGDVVHSGEWSRGRVSGPCTRAHSNGDAYEGGCEGMARDGEGVCAFGNGDVYRGEWRDDQPHGARAPPRQDASGAAGGQTDAIDFTKKEVNQQFL